MNSPILAEREVRPTQFIQVSVEPTDLFSGIFAHPAVYRLSCQHDGQVFTRHLWANADASKARMFQRLMDDLKAVTHCDCELPPTVKALLDR